MQRHSWELLRGNDLHEAGGDVKHQPAWLKSSSVGCEVRNARSRRNSTLQPKSAF
jgi:hypothetical protein